MASEQSARMVAMKAATDNAGNVINELKLVYNKTRQAAITKELSRSSPVRRQFKFWSKKWLKFKARLFNVSAPWWTWSSRATRCPRCMTPQDGRLCPDAGVQQQLGDGIVRTIAWARPTACAAASW